MANEDRKTQYPNLNATFFRGSLEGQVNSVYKTKDTNAGKVEDFCKAVAAGEITLGDKPLKKSIATKLVQLGVEVPAELLPASTGEE